MKTILAAFAAATVLSSAAFAADPVVYEEPITDYNLFLTAKIGYGPSLIDNELRSDEIAAIGGARVEGKFEDEYLAGVAVEAGAFLTKNIRLSIQGTIGRIEHEQQNIESAGPLATGRIDFEGHTNIYQGFLKAAYETRLSDVGFTAPLFERSSVFATAGIGFTHLDSNATVTEGTFSNSRSEDSDTVLSGLVGVGSVYDFNDRISLISEVNYVFGKDATLDLTNTPVGDVPFEIETNAITFQTGLRFKF